MIIKTPWNILLPGPNLDFEKVHWEWPTIAVNAAIVGAKRVDYLCCRDKPCGWLEDAIKEAKKLRPALIVSSNQRARTLWEKEISEWEPNERPPFITTINWNDYDWIKLAVGPNARRSVFFAMFFALETGQAHDLHLHGCQMSGTKYHNEDIQARPQKWDPRWASEKEDMVKLFKFLRDQGKRIIGLPRDFIVENNLI